MTSESLNLGAIMDWLEGRLEPDEAARIAAEVEHGGREAAELVDWARTFLDAARIMPLQAPPPELRSRLSGLFLRVREPHTGSGWSSATLLYDTRDPQSAVGLRSATESVSLGFGSALGRFVVDVVHTDAGTVDINGLIMAAPDHAGIEVSLLQAGELRRAARIDHRGRFELPGVPVEADELWLTSGEERGRAPLDLRDGGHA